MAEFTLTQVRYFVAAGSTGSMTAAAAELRVAQSAISAAVAALERSFGVQLFIRMHARGLSLTNAGQRLHAEAQELLDHAAGLQESAWGIAFSARGTVALGCFVTLAPFVVPHVASQCARRYPELDLHLYELGTEDLLDGLRDGGIDLALMYDLRLGDEVERRRIATARPYVLLPVGHTLAGSDGVRLSDLGQDPMIMLDIPRSTEYFEDLVRAAGFTPRVRYRSTSYETVRGLVAEGHGYAVLNQQPLFATTYAGGSTRAVPLLDDVPTLSIVLARMTRSRSTARAAALADVCRTVVPQVTDPWARADRSRPPDCARA